MRVVSDDHGAAKPVAVQEGNDVNPPSNDQLAILKAKRLL